MRRPMLRMLTRERVFDRIAVLKGVGVLSGVFDADGTRIFSRA